MKKLDKQAILPKREHEGDAGLDLYSIMNLEIAPNERVKIGTGIAMSLPLNYVGLLWDKSGLASKEGLKVLGGVIDAGYRGEIIVAIINLSENKYKVEKGQKIAQLLIQKVELPEVCEVSELEDTKRGFGGFGSTGI